MMQETLHAAPVGGLDLCARPAGGMYRRAIYRASPLSGRADYCCGSSDGMQTLPGVRGFPAFPIWERNRHGGHL